MSLTETRVVADGACLQSLFFGVEVWGIFLVNLNGVELGIYRYVRILVICIQFGFQ